MGETTTVDIMGALRRQTMLDGEESSTDEEREIDEFGGIGRRDVTRVLMGRANSWANRHSVAIGRRV